MFFKLRDQLFTVACPNCEKERQLSYAGYWYIKKNPQTTCQSCRPKNLQGLKKGHGWNKGITGKDSHSYGHKPYIIMLGEDNPAWKGDQAGYVALHYWVRRQLGIPTQCSKNKKHISKMFVWANKSGEYKRNASDWHSLCNSWNLTDGITLKNEFDEKLHRREMVRWVSV